MYTEFMETTVLSYGMVPKEVSILLKGFKGQHNIVSGHRGIMFDSEIHV